MKLSAKTIIKGYAYAWITLVFFLGSLVLHWWFGWRAFIDEAAQHGQSPQFSQFAIQAARDTFESRHGRNRQSLVEAVETAQVGRVDLDDPGRIGIEVGAASERLGDMHRCALQRCRHARGRRILADVVRFEHRRRHALDAGGGEPRDLVGAEDAPLLDRTRWRLHRVRQDGARRRLQGNLLELHRIPLKAGLTDR